MTPPGRKDPWETLPKQKRRNRSGKEKNVPKEGYLRKKGVREGYLQEKSEGVRKEKHHPEK